MRFAGELFALMTAVLWATSALIFAIVTRKISSFQANVFRLIVAEFFFALYFFLRQIPLSISPQQVLFLSLSGVVGLSVGDTFLFRAFQEIGARISMLLMTIAPLIGAGLAAVFLHERLGIWSILGMVVTLSGVALVVVERTAEGGAKFAISARGIVFGLMGASGQGIGLILAKLAFLEGPLDGFVATAVRILAGLLVLVPTMLMTGRSLFPLKGIQGMRGTFGLLILGAFFGSFLGISTSLMSITLTSVGVASTIMALVPVFMLPLVWIVFRETLHWKAVIGAVTSFAGVSLLFMQ